MLTLQGQIVISLGFFKQSDGITLTEEQEKILREMHYGKIDLSDEIYVIDVGGYIGDSTRKEKYAKEKGKMIRYYSKETVMHNKPIEYELLLKEHSEYFIESSAY